MVWCHVCKILKRLYNGFLLFSVPYFILELILSNKYEIDDIEGRLMANSWCTRNNDSSPTTMDNIHKSAWSTCGTITFFYKYPSPPELVEFISGTGKKIWKFCLRRVLSAGWFDVDIDRLTACNSVWSQGIILCAATFIEYTISVRIVFSMQLPMRRNLFPLSLILLQQNNLLSQSIFILAVHLLWINAIFMTEILLFMSCNRMAISICDRTLCVHVLCMTKTLRLTVSNTDTFTCTYVLSLDMNCAQKLPLLLLLLVRLSLSHSSTPSTDNQTKQTPFCIPFA